MFKISFHEPNYIAANVDGIDSDRYLFEYTIEENGKKQKNRLKLSIPETYLASSVMSTYNHVNILSVMLKFAMNIIESKLKENALQQLEDIEINDVYLEHNLLSVDNIEYQYDFDFDLE
ncbi:hypothetical protein ACFLSX_05545 [Calditrichota bacterium]